MSFNILKFPSYMSIWSDMTLTSCDLDEMTFRWSLWLFIVNFSSKLWMCILDKILVWNWRLTLTFKVCRQLISKYKHTKLINFLNICCNDKRQSALLLTRYFHDVTVRRERPIYNKFKYSFYGYATVLISDNEKKTSCLRYQFIVLWFMWKLVWRVTQ